jgi:hypothetical protein
MAQQTATTMADVLKEGWSADRLQGQFEDKNLPLGRLEAYRGVVMGRQVNTPILAGRAGAYTSVGAAGGNLNDPIPQPVTKAFWSMPYSWFQIALDTSALIQSGQDVQSIVAGKDLEIKGAVENTRHQMSRQVVTGGDGIVAACDTGGPAAAVKLINAASEGASYGYSALMRGWLQAGFPVQIGTTADIDALTTGLGAGPGVGQIAGRGWIQSVDRTASAPTITLQAAITTVAGTHFAYVPNPNSATAANPEMNGIRQLIGSGTFGGINPATAGFDFWAGAARDVTTTTFSLDLALNLQRLVMQNSGNAPAEIWSGFKQQMNLYALLQSQVQYSGDGAMNVGNVNAPTWNGMKIQAMADILDTDFFMLTPSDLFRVKGNVDQPRWASDVAGGGSLEWKQGTTQFVDGVVYPINLGAQRRNTQAGAINLK